MQTEIRLVQTNTIPLTFWRFAEGQLNFLKKMGFVVTAVTSPGPLFEECEAREDVHFIPLFMTRKISPYRDIISLLKMIRILRLNKPHILQGSTPKAAFLSMLAGKILKIPVRIFLMRGLRYTGLNGWRRKLVKTIEKLTCSWADHVLSTSASIRDLAIKANICPSNKIKLIKHGTTNGINIKTFDPSQFTKEIKNEARKKLDLSENSRVLLFVGRMVREKGLIDLFYAWLELRGDYPDLHLLLVGPEEQQDPVPENILKWLREDPRVHITGFIKDIAIIYSLATLLVLPSYREGIPYAPLEAGAMGVPSVATRIPGCVDSVIDGVTGTLVPVRKAKELAQAIRKYLDNPQLIVRHGWAAKERVVKDFSPQAIWKFYLLSYTRLLKEKGLLNPLENSIWKG